MSNLTLLLFLQLNSDEFVTKPSSDDEPPAKKGKGLSKSYHQKIHKFYLDKNKLNNGILEIRYVSNKHLLMQPLVMNKKFKKCFNQLMDYGQLDMKDFNLLSQTEKELIRKLVKVFNLDVAIDDDSSFASNFELLKGEYKAGNDSVELKNKLKEYIMHAMNTNQISKNVAKNLLIEIGMQ